MLVNKSFGQLFDFSRPTSADFEDEAGDIQTAGVDVPRFEYINGEPQGLKFGDGDSLSLKSEFTQWNNPNEGTFVIRIGSELGDKAVLESGNLSIDGVNGLKTYIIRYDSSLTAGNLDFYTEAPDDSTPRYLRYVYYVPREIEIEDIEFMEGFNSVVNV